MPKASDKKPRATILSLSLSLSFHPGSPSARVRHRANRCTLRCSNVVIVVVVVVVVVESLAPASVKNAAAKQRGGITVRRCSIFIPPSFDDKVRRKEGESFRRRRGTGKGKMKARGRCSWRERRAKKERELLPRASGPVEGARSLSESGSHRTRYRAGIRDAYGAFRGYQGPRLPWDLIIRIGRRSVVISARVKARAVGALLYTHFNARARG